MNSRLNMGYGLQFAQNLTAVPALMSRCYTMKTLPGFINKFDLSSIPHVFHSTIIHFKNYKYEDFISTQICGIVLIQFPCVILFGKSGMPTFT